LGHHPYPAAANFILVRSGRAAASDLYEKLHRKNILIRRCANFSGLDDRYFRIAVRGTSENDALLCAMAQIRN
jgi:threonine-phosphate decarboxylase